MSTISASDARQTLPAQLDRVEAGEEVSITRHGKVVAVLVRPDVLVARRAHQAFDQAERIGARLAQARTAPLSPAAISAARADELAEGVQAARSDR
jgi:antitoxin (DNA-binding transcriptional repressor) of toxin-antitoxin stability system